MDSTQRLYVSALNPNPGEELSFRTKDPMWFLSRQWQSGEFQAENGGKPAAMFVTKRDHPLKSAVLGKKQIPLNLDVPLDAVVEDETGADGDSPAWNSAALEYEFDVNTAEHTLSARDYQGRDLDWWHFSLAKQEAQRVTKADETRMTPANISFKGAPHPRWWRLEDSDAYFDSPVDPEPNVLSMLLPEFFYSDVENWYVLPLPIRSGCLREVDSVRVVDSFGVVETLDPAVTAGQKNDWRLYALDTSDKATPEPDGRYLFAPHTAHAVLDNDTIEDVRILRDEQSNMVWAVEEKYQDADGKTVDHGDSARLARPAAVADHPEGTIGQFILRSETPLHWIPYVPRYEKARRGLPSGEIYLRRGRTDETSDRNNPQFSGQILSESWQLNEEEIGDATVRVRRIHRYTRGPDGRARFWVGRCRDTTSRLSSGSNLVNDFVRK